MLSLDLILWMVGAWLRPGASDQMGDKCTATDHAATRQQLSQNRYSTRTMLSWTGDTSPTPDYIDGNGTRLIGRPRRGLASFRTLFVDAVQPTDAFAQAWTPWFLMASQWSQVRNRQKHTGWALTRLRDSSRLRPAMGTKHCFANTKRIWTLADKLSLPQRKVRLVTDQNVLYDTPPDDGPTAL